MKRTATSIVRHPVWPVRSTSDGLVEPTGHRGAMTMTPESLATTEAAAQTRESLDDLRAAITSLAIVQEKAAASTDRLGTRMVWIAFLAALATIAQAGAAVVTLYR